MRCKTAPKRLSDWRPWFAWNPVQIDDEWIWLETVHRRGTFRENIAHCYWHWEWRHG